MTRKELEHETANLLVNLNFGTPTSTTDAAARATDYENLLLLFPEYSDATLRRFTETSTSDLGWALSWELNVLLRHSPAEDYINDWIATQPVAQIIKTDIADHIINGFGEYQKLEPQDNGHYPMRRTQQVQAITRPPSLRSHRVWVQRGR